MNNCGRIPSWDCVRISISPNLPQYAGRTVLSLAEERGQDPVDTLCDYLADDQGATRVLVTSISEDDIETIVASPTALIGSDGNCVAPYGAAFSRAPQDDGDRSRFATVDMTRMTARASPAPRSIHIDAFCRLVAHRPAP